MKLHITILSIFSLAVVACSPMSVMVKTSPDITEVPSMYGLPYEEIWFETDDGVELHAYFVSGFPGRPIIVFFHGNSANISDSVVNLCYLRTIGTPVFVFDYRGYGISEGQPRKEDDFYQDGKGAIKYLQKRGWKPSDMIYYGRSMGGAIALQVALEEPPAGLVLEGAWTSLRKEARHTSPFLYYLIGWWGIPDIFNNLEKIHRLEVPLLIIHGDQDTVVPTEMSWAIYKEAPDPKVLNIVKGGGHSNSHLADGENYWNQWIVFLEAQGFSAEIIPENKVCEDGPIMINKPQ